MKEILKAENFSFSYEGSSECVLKDIDFTIDSGEMVLVCGKSGSGKTTLLKFLKSGAHPKGMSIGKIKYGFSEETFVGYMPQNAEDGIVTDKVWHELAFGLENQGKSRDYIRRKVAEAVSFFGLSQIYDEEINKLSGGMKQLVLLASIMVMEPKLLILDEPISQLDPISAADFVAMLRRIHTELGTTIVISEHRLSEMLELSDRLLVLDAGRVFYNGLPEKVLERVFENETAASKVTYGLMPPSVKIFKEFGGGGSAPLNINECRQWLKEEFNCKEGIHKDNSESDNGCEKSQKAVVIKNLTFSFSKNGEYVLHKLNMSVNEGEIHAVLGANGCGKTTLLSCIAGVYDRYTGKISTGGKRVALVSQNPRLMFVKETVREDFEVMKKLNKGQFSDEEIEHLMNKFEIEHVLDRYPYDLSGGEIQKAAMVKVLLAKPDIILLDEPAKGMDGEFKNEFIAILKELADQGKTIITVTHDIEFAAHCADRCTLIFNGDASVTEKTNSFFSGNTFYTTDAARISAGITEIDGAITEEEIIEKLRKNGGDSDRGEPSADKADKKEVFNANDVSIEDDSIENDSEVKNKTRKQGTPNNAVMTLLIVFSVFVLIPFTIWFGTVKLEDRKYFFISLLILVEALLPAFILYEYRQTDLVRLVTDAVLCALTVAGRAVFYMLPNFKPVIAMVTISGIAMGPIDGFIIGAVSMLVSDIFFGQGPWTPWQMLAMGLIGMLSGLVGKIKLVREKTVFLCVLGALFAIVIFGGIMNPASVIMYQPDINAKMLLYSYVAGFPVDCVQAAATVIFLAIGAKPFLRRLERLKRINEEM